LVGLRLSTLILICYSIALSLMVREAIASETSIFNGTNTTEMLNSIENLTQSNATRSKNAENMTETEQTGSISGRTSIPSPSLRGNCTVC
jgi:hypothetical protein